MNKLWIILKREYFTRVKKKSFILATLLTPIGFGVLMFVAGYITSQGGKSEKQILVNDAAGVLNEATLSSNYMKFSFSDEPVDSLKKNYIADGYDILLYLAEPPTLEQERTEVLYYSRDKLSFITLESLEDEVRDALRDYKIQLSEIDQEKLKNIETRVNMENGAFLEGDEDAGSSASKVSTAISTGLSYAMGFLMYMVIFIFGSMVMRSVTEEKINRIVEVIISSVKPFQLMLGKILGVGLVGLTQLLIWIILIPVLLTLVSMYFGTDAMQSQEVQQAQEMLAEADRASGGNGMQTFITEFLNLNWWLILPSFIIFFFGGFLIYSSFFAAIGSTISDDLGEAQQFMLPIVVPVIIALVMIPAVFNDPDGGIAIFGSMFPLFSPILMPARLPFDPPIWQLIVSILILIASVIFFIWVAGRIYRVGIFMYGKKINFKEIGKWLFYH